MLTADWYQKWNRTSLNTLRVLTVRGTDGVKALSTILRFGAEGSSTDNISAGGLAIGVREGVLAPYAIDRYMRRMLPHGRRVEPEVVPFFAEAGMTVIARPRFERKAPRWNASWPPVPL